MAKKETTSKFFEKTVKDKRSSLDKTLTRELFYGEVPFFINELPVEKQIVYVAISNRSLEDYAYVLEEYFKREVFVIESFNLSDEEFSSVNYQLLDILNKKLIGNIGSGDGTHTNENKVIATNREARKGVKSNKSNESNKNREIKQVKKIILTSTEGVLRDYFKKEEGLNIITGEDFNYDQIEKELLEANFNKSYLVEKYFDYSKRGDILDIYPLSSKYPVRIEFFGDTVERITHFNPENQKTMEVLDRVHLIIKAKGENSGSIIDLLNEKLGPGYDIFLENEELFSFKVEEFLLNNRASEKKYRQNYKLLLENTQKVLIKHFDKNKLEMFKDNKKVKSLAKSKELTIFSRENKNYQKELGKSEISYEKFPYYAGFERDKKLYLTDRELKGIRVKNHYNKPTKIKYKSVEQLLEGDYIIHENYGVGEYLGIETIDDKDYIKIRYAGEDKLFVPVEGLNRIEKYLYEPGKIPQVFTLGRKGFSKRKARLQEEILEFAKELIEIQAKRQANNGFAFLQDTVWQEEFEAGFAYNETRDQLQAINDVKADMESGKVMDRIVCGDVGYGKTEVALRAAFKAIMSGKQVVILAPTTVLANQHYKLCKSRFDDFSVETEVLSRLKTTKEQGEVIKKLKKGLVDLVIGTHRLLSEDIGFANLGLVIIDEEQKFSVTAKEKLKRLRNNVDLLTLTATPIPRTLNLALLGIRDLSVIETPPPNRVGVKSIVIEKNDESIKRVIMEEVAREGQVFYLFNRVRGMERRLKELQKILPGYLTIDYIHGQLPPKEIKEKLQRFENQEIDILMTTTIIENGIDIENSNTIIIEDYQKLGLAQLYQLRGRVGRSNRQGYCYLLLEKGKGLTKTGEKRQKILQDIDELGGGFSLSMEDMRIRGAGEILGEKQHGAIELLGYNFYLKLLDEEVQKLKGQKQERPLEKELNTSEKAYIPDWYIKDSEKVQIYKRLLQIDTVKKIEELRLELRDRFGKLPLEVQNLLNNCQLKVLMDNHSIKKIVQVEDTYRLSFDHQHFDFDKIQEKIKAGVLKYHPKTDEVSFKGDLKRFLLEEF